MYIDSESYAIIIDRFIVLIHVKSRNSETLNGVICGLIIFAPLQVTVAD